MGYALRAGIQPSEFWQLTPFALGILLDAHGEQLRLRLAHVWYGAYLQRVKKMPSLLNFVGERPEKKQAREIAALDAALDRSAAFNRVKKNG